METGKKNSGATRLMKRKRPGKSELHIWLWQQEADSETIEELEQMLSDDEWRRVRRLQCRHAARRFIVRRGALRWILGKYLVLPPQEVRLVYGCQGKPGLAPEMCCDLQFSLSDSGELALLAVTTEHPVGADLEKVGQRADRGRVAEKALAARELDVGRRTTAPERALRFLQSWTRKEAVAKATGTGLSTIENILDAQVNARKSHHYPRSHAYSHPQEMRILQPALPDGFTGAVATCQEIESVSYHSLSNLYPKLASGLDLRNDTPYIEKRVQALVDT